MSRKTRAYLGRGLVVAAGLGFACALGCAHAINYVELDGPIYRGTPDSSAIAAALADSDTTLRIVTFNIAYGRQYERAAVGLRSHPDLRGADVILLQEMNAPAVQWIARELGMSYVYYPASLEEDGSDMGEAVLSPWPIEESAKIILPHLTRIVGRSHAAVRAHVRVRGRELRVYSVHLGSPLGLSGHNRREEAETVLADADSCPEPVIIAGDLNSKDVGNLFVKRGYAWPTRDLGHTVMLFSFDHIFVRGMGTAMAAGVAKEVDDASDHRPVWVTLPH